MHTEYRWCLAQAEADPDVRAVVVTGAGRGFCAGADTAALDGHVQAGRYDPGTPDELARPGYGVRPEYDHAFAFHFGMRLPVIAAVNGRPPVSGSCSPASATSASPPRAPSSRPRPGRLGLPAEYGLSWVLPRLVGVGHAADLLISSRVVEADEAARMGLVNRVLPQAELLPAALAYAQDIATSISPASARAAKAQLYADLHGDVGFAVARSEALLEQMVRRPDFAEGVAAWRDRRVPEWPAAGAR